MKSNGVALVDVLLPVKGESPWLQEALDSLVDQDLQFHLVLVQHGPDMSQITERSRRFHSVSLVRVRCSATLGQALNEGLKRCQTDFVARLDADDIAKPGRLLRQYRLLKGRDNAAFVASSVELIDSDGVTFGVKSVPDSNSLYRGLLWRNRIAHPSVMLRKSLVQQAGGYDPNAVHCEDYELWLRLLRHHHAITTADALTKYRVHDAQVTRTKHMPAQARSLIKQARQTLAAARGYRPLEAHIAHQLWDLRQRLRHSVNSGRSQRP